MLPPRRHPALPDTGLLLGRIAVGAVFVAHGWQKLTDEGHAAVARSFGHLGILGRREHRGRVVRRDELAEHGGVGHGGAPGESLAPPPLVDPAHPAVGVLEHDQSLSSVVGQMLGGRLGSTRQFASTSI